MNLARTTNWSAGSNNIAKPERLPDNSIVSATNLDVTVGGKLELRAGFDAVMACTDARALFSCGQSLVLVDGDQLIALDRQAGSQFTVATIAAAGPVSAAFLNGSLYLNTLTDSLKFDGESVSPWAIYAPRPEVVAVDGALPEGVYKVAVTAIQGGVESGAMPVILVLDGSQELVISCADNRECLVYCSTANGQTLYRQGAIQSGSMRIDYIADNSERLQTAELECLPFCDQLSAHQSMILGSRGRLLCHTEPMWPHLFNPITGFVQFPSDIAMHISVGSGVFVATTDKTYFISGIGTADISQREVFDFGAVPGTSVLLPDGSACWFTRYGQAIGAVDGSVSLPNRTAYSPDTGSIGAAGLLEYNGNQMVVTNMRGEVKGNNLRAGDFADLEIINNV